MFAIGTEGVLRGAATLALLVAMGFGPALAQEAASEEATEEAATEAASEEAAAEGPVDLTGLWIMNVETPDGAASEGELTVTEEGGVYSGVWVTDIGEGHFENINVEGNNIDFASEVDFGGVLVPISFEGTRDGASIAGMVHLDFEGQPMDLPVTGTKFDESVAAGPPTGPVDLPGEWEIEAVLPDGTASVSMLTVTEGEGGALNAVMQTEIGEAKVDAIEVTGNDVNFTAEIDMGGVMVPLTVAGIAGGERIEGNVKLNFEGQDMELPFQGKKLSPAEEILTGVVNLPGWWDLQAELPDGSVSSAGMTVSEVDGVLTAHIETEIGEAHIQDIVIDGNAVAFDTQVDMGGVLVPFSFAGSTGDDQLKGHVKLDMDGQIMELPISGTRAGDAPATATEAAPTATEAAPAAAGGQS